MLGISGYISDVQTVQQVSILGAMTVLTGLGATATLTIADCRLGRSICLAIIVVRLVAA